MWNELISVIRDRRDITGNDCAEKIAIRNELKKGIWDGRVITDNDRADQVVMRNK